MADFTFRSDKKKVEGAIDAGIERALETIGLVAEGYAVVGAPHDTGRLRSSISHATVTNKGKGSYTDDKGNSYNDASNTEPVKKGEVIIFTNVEYAAHQEYGTSNGVKPKHYMKNAAEKHKNEYRDIINENLPHDGNML